jgi:hypothetical protein
MSQGIYPQGLPKEHMLQTSGLGTVLCGPAKIAPSNHGGPSCFGDVRCFMKPHC